MEELTTDAIEFRDGQVPLHKADKSFNRIVMKRASAAALMRKVFGLVKKAIDRVDDIDVRVAQTVQVNLD
jgi:hypothetical protein